MLEFDSIALKQHCKRPVFMAKIKILYIPGLSMDDDLGPTAIDNALRASFLSSELVTVTCLVLAGLVDPPGRLEISAHL